MLQQCELDEDLAGLVGVLFSSGDPEHNNLHLAVRLQVISQFTSLLEFVHLMRKASGCIRSQLRCLWGSEAVP